MTLVEQTETFQLAAYGCVAGVGRRTLRKARRYRTEQNWSWQDFWVPTEAVCRFLSLSTKQIESIKKSRYEHIAARLLKGIDAHSIRLIGTEDEEYPPLLREVDDPPPVLFAKGAVAHWEQAALPIAVVGTRNVTLYGRMATEKIASELAELGAVLISGLMYGVDTIAHLTAVRSGGKTVAVLGYGFDHCYPQEHRPVLDELLAQGATFLTEYPPWKIANKGNFPARNSIVAGMSAAVVVTEAAEKSGSMITAQCANDEGRAVCAVPGPITNPYCEGTKCLINQGAVLVGSGAEIVEQLTPSYTATNYRPARKRTPHVSRLASYTQLSAEMQRIISFLSQTEADIDALETATGLSQQQLLVELTSLELLAVVDRQGSQWCLR